MSLNLNNNFTIINIKYEPTDIFSCNCISFSSGGFPLLPKCKIREEIQS